MGRLAMCTRVTAVTVLALCAGTVDSSRASRAPRTSRVERYARRVSASAAAAEDLSQHFAGSHDTPSQAAEPRRASSAVLPALRPPEPAPHLADELRRAYSAVDSGASAGVAEPSLRRSLRKAYEPRLPPVARAPSSEKIERMLERVRVDAGCEVCASVGRVLCQACAGKSDVLLYNLMPAQIISSKWTSVVGDGEVLVTVLKLGVRAKRVYAQVAGASEGTLLAWVPLADLRNRSRWRSGWLTVAQRCEAATYKSCPGGCDEGWAECKACHGSAGPLSWGENP
ncbi:hypothetical protein T492DRAFT_938934 [Pavlovales sp. CCMP2436]|nr:hypothetical protein T492DRAFT_938934 [Pavlovales sp. CCMP2436]|mmetsp:Transcript_10939/g.26149  ORF Transcript_10939/g.26149 Transcript_10939/m.26149 type:complete len:284 (-) Transcript_10939:125-976(-)